LKTVWKKSATRSLSHYLNLKMADYLTRRAPELVQVRGYKQMAIFANDNIGILVNQFGIFEREELDDLFAFLAPLREQLAGGVALDVGANVGNHALYFSRHFAQIHSFEPNPRTFELLRFNTAGITNVAVHGIGLGDADGEITLQQDLLHPGLSSMRSGKGGGHQSVSVRVETLDNYPFDGRSGLCFIKMDVEGFEANVLRGAVATIAAQQPLIVFEQHETEFEGGSSPSVTLLRNMGYSFSWEFRRRPSGFWLGRRMSELAEVVFGRTCRYVAGDVVPAANYTMLVAVPPRFRPQLGI
jgi:FkbM family methyltransferase